MLAWGDADGALVAAQTAYAEFIQIGDQVGQARTQTSIGQILVQQGAVAEAEPWLLQAWQRLADLATERGLAEIVGVLAAVAVARQDAVRAAQLLGYAQALRDRLGHAAHGR